MNDDFEYNVMIGILGIFVVGFALGMYVGFWLCELADKWDRRAKPEPTR